jgi:hypothetical protein
MLAQDASKQIIVLCRNQPGLAQQPRLERRLHFCQVVGTPSPTGAAAQSAQRRTLRAADLSPTTDCAQHIHARYDHRVADALFLEGTDEGSEYVEPLVFAAAPQRIGGFR